ncbi:hypothetical protein E2C01_092013 [Portunus trituberculatus]|uniref:Uncharacterized protein n=1 Tax=Portunus trituberculatus TaxID=210409 RepID=A0A5B7JUD2_PORTR|nr:hypothetical protein [Portunus trituberculatus]
MRGEGRAVRACVEVCDGLQLSGLDCYMQSSGTQRGGGQGNTGEGSMIQSDLACTRPSSVRN